MVNAFVGLVSPSDHCTNVAPSGAVIGVVMRLSELAISRVVSGAGPPPPFTANCTPGTVASTNTLCSSIGKLKLAVVE